MREVRGELTYFNAMKASYMGQAAVAIADGAEALALLPAKAQRLRGQAVGSQTMGWQMSGDPDKAVTVLDQALSDPAWSNMERCKFLYYRSVVYFLESDLIMAHRSADESIRLAMNEDLWDTLNQARYISGVAHYLRNEPALAEPLLQAMLHNPVLASPEYLVQAVFLLARIYNAEGLSERAGEVLQFATSHLKEMDSTILLETLDAFQVELALDQGDVSLARRLSLTVDFDMNRPIWFYYVVQLTPVKLLLAERAAESLTQALTALEQMDEQLLGMNRKIFRIDVLALQAMAHDALGDWRAASEVLNVALRLAEPGGLVRSFVDLGQPMNDLLARLYHQLPASQQSLLPFIARVLASFPKPGTNAPPAKPIPHTSPPATTPPVPLESLTRRESQILKLLATELTPEEMARELSVSTSTVRTHIRNIYAKLDVHRRLEAVHRAVELGLL